MGGGGEAAKYFKILVILYCFGVTGKNQEILKQSCNGFVYFGRTANCMINYPIIFSK